MQSLRQYRRFRRNLQEQIDRHGLERVASCAVQPNPVVSRDVIHHNETELEDSRGYSYGNRAHDSAEKQLESASSEPQPVELATHVSGIKLQPDAQEPQSIGTGAAYH